MLLLRVIPSIIVACYDELSEAVAQTPLFPGYSLVNSQRRKRMGGGEEGEGVRGGGSREDTKEEEEVEEERRYISEKRKGESGRDGREKTSEFPRCSGNYDQRPQGHLGGENTEQRTGHDHTTLPVMGGKL